MLPIIPALALDAAQPNLIYPTRPHIIRPTDREVAQFDPALAGIGPIAAARRRSAGGGGGDPYWSNVQYLAGFETNLLQDESSYNRTVTKSTGTTQPLLATGGKFGTFCMSRIASGFIWVADGAQWPTGTTPFTFETWIQFRASASSGFLHFAGQWDNNGQECWAFSVNSNVLTLYLSTNGTSATNTVTAAWAPSTAVWYHAAADYNGSVFRTYLNGVMKGKLASALSLFNSTAPFTIGSVLNTTSTGGALSSGAANSNFDGFLDETRLTVGVARYASDAGFTVPTAAYPRS